MTRPTNARLAGVAFLAYIGTGIADLILFAKATTGADVAARLASLAQHLTAVRVSALLELLTFFEAATLAVTLYALTRDEDADLALLAFACRIAEGVLGAVAAVGTLRLASAAAASVTTSADSDAARALATSLLVRSGSSGTIGALCFAVGSTLFCYLFLRARSIPIALAWLGVIASALLVIMLPVQLAGFLPRAVEWPMWMPMLAFELTFASWLIFTGMRPRNLTA
jgi:hypothetical protein